MHCYDALDQVVYAVTIREYSDYEQGDSEIVLDLRGSFPGSGIDSPKRWLERVLQEVQRSL